MSDEPILDTEYPYYADRAAGQAAEQRRQGVELERLAENDEDPAVRSARLRARALSRARRERGER